VVRESTNVGIANARITLRQAGAGEFSESLSAVADSEGRFTFPSVNPSYPPIGQGYDVTAGAEGYQPARYGTAGENLYLLNGARSNITFKLNPYRTISGTVRTPDYLPVAASLIRGYRVRYSLLGRRMKIVKTGLSNDLGDYRLFGVEPGDYYVSASYGRQARELPLSGPILTPNLSNPDAGYVTQYYPAAVSPPEATVFTMLPNLEKTNLNITLKETPRFKVHILVFAASSSSAHQFNIAMMPDGAELEDALDYAIDKNGSSDFEVENVGAGHYSLVAFDKSRLLSEPVPITVNDNIEARITVYDPLDIPYAIVDEQGNDVSRPEWKIRLVRTDPALGQTIRSDLDSGKFVVQDVGPGSYDVYLDGLPPGTYIREIQFPVNDGQFAKFGRIRIEPDRPKRILDTKTLRWKSESELRIVLAKSDLVVVGWVSTEAIFLRGVRGAMVLLEPDRDRESPYAFREDRFISATAASSGFFRFEGVPPGNYKAFAFYDIPTGLYFDSEFNDRISDRGIRVTVMPGSRIEMIFEMTGCVGPPPYRDRIYDIEPRFPITPPPDHACLVPLPREETMGVDRP